MPQYDAPKGRPVGSKETPFSLLETDLKQTLKLHKEIRELIQTTLEKLRERLDLTEDYKERLDTLDTLAKMSDTLTKSAQQSAKFVMSEGDKAEAQMSSTSMDELLMGKKR
jgi:hypothetical protein